MKRLRVTLARLLVRGIGVSVVRDSVVRSLEARCMALDAYVDQSGALQSPHRIRAYRRVRGDTAAVRELAHHIVVG